MPSVKCDGCAKFLSSLEGAACTKCSALYHRACASLPVKGCISPTWLCSECKKGTMKGRRGKSPPKQDKNTSPVETTSSDECLDVSSVQSPEDNREVSLRMAEELRLFREEMRAELRTLQAEFRSFRDELVQMRATVRACTERMDMLDLRLNAVEQQQITQTKSPIQVDQLVAQLKKDLNDRDQDLLANDVEVAELPEEKGENLSQIITVIAAKLGIKLEPRDIVSVDRVGGRHMNATNPTGVKEVRPRPVVIRLARRDLRDELLRGARVRRGITAADIGMTGNPKRLYVNERLTKQNRLLFRKTREAGQRQGWQFIWTNRGRILARQKHGEAAYPVRDDTDLLRIFGPNPGNDTEK